jgi:FtsX-like permease family
MHASAARVVWYRFRITLHRRWGGYLALAVLIGLVGGVAMASMIAARRTYASYPAFLASTNPSDLVVQPFTAPGYSPGFVAQLAALPHVRRVAVAVPLSAAILTPHGKVSTVLLARVQLAASPDGLYSGQDRITIIRGRRADPARPGEVVASQDAAALLGLHVGSHVLVGLISQRPKAPAPYRRLDLTVVGIGVFNTQVLQDSVDSGRTGFLLGTAALARQFASCCASGMIAGLRLSRGSADDIVVDKEYQRLVATSHYVQPGGSELQIYITSAIEAQAQRAIRPEAVALGVFAVIAMVAALLIGIQIITRQLQAGVQDAVVLRALGAGPTVTVADGLPGIAGSVAAGSLIAAAVAIALSPSALFGPVRLVDSSPGVDLDWAVLALGSLVLIVALGGVAAVVAYRQAPHRLADRGAARTGSGVVRAALAAGLPASAVAGLRFALEPGRGRTAVPVRSVLAGAVLAAGVGVATLTFGASLNSLVSHPRLYGWNFSFALYGVQGWGPVPARWIGPLLASDASVRGSTGVYFVTVQVDGQTVGGMLVPTHPKVPPELLSGHGLDQASQIVLGPATLAQLHKRIGDTVTVASGNFHIRLRIVGTASMPTIGTVLSIHPTMSTGAIISTAVLGRKGFGGWGSLSGPNAVFIRLRPGISAAAGLRSLRRINAELNQRLASPQVVAASGGLSQAFSVELLPPQRPAEIVNYRSMGTMPAILSGGLAAGAVAALGLTLVTSVRRRRRDFALLKTLGFTRGQLAGAIAWQSTVIVTVGLAVGVPLGITAGRWLWLLFARQLAAVPDPVIPAASVALACLAALILANLVAALPGQAAARTRAALVLRSE